MTAIELAMTRGQAPGTFRVEVVCSPAGEASAVVSLDVEPLLARREELERTVLASAAATRAVLSHVATRARQPSVHYACGAGSAAPSAPSAGST